MESVQLNWVKRRTSHEPYWLNWVRLMWGTPFDPGQRAFHVLRRKSLETEHYFNGQAYRPHQSVTKTWLYGNCRTGGIWTRKLCFSSDGKIWKELLKRWHHANDGISLSEFSLNTNSKCLVSVAVLNSSDVVWTEKIWCVFKCETRKESWYM